MPDSGARTPRPAPPGRGTGDWRSQAVSIGWLAAVVGCLLAFAATAVVALGPDPSALDQGVTDGLRDIASPALDTVMRAITSLGSTLPLALIAGMAVVALASRGRPAEAAFMLAAFLGSVTLNEALKRLFERPRPALDWAEPASGYGFPSGHAMNATVIYGALALIAWQLWGPRAGVAALVLGLSLAALIGSSRVYLGVHWTTDVIGGLLAGFVVLLALAAALERRR